MSQLKRNQVADAETVDFDWKGLCRIGGVAAWMQLLCLLVTLAVVSTLGGEPSTADEYFTMFQNDRLVGFLRLDFSTTILLFFFAVMFFGIYAALRRTSGAYAAFATALVFVGVTLCLATDSGFSMLHLSDQYAAATTDVQRSQLLAAGEAIIASDMWNSTAGFMAGMLHLPTTWQEERQIREKSLELLDLLVIQDDLAEFADPGVDPVHDLPGRELLLQHGAATLDALQRRRGQYDLFAIPRDAHHLCDGQAGAVQNDRHRLTLRENP